MRARLGGVCVCVCACVAVLAACFNPKPNPGAPCATGDLCPTGLTCIGGLCVTGGGGSADAAIDALAPDAPPIDASRIDASLVGCVGMPDGTACGDPTSTECNAPDTCLGGACVGNLASSGTTCGSAEASACVMADTCDGAGACATHIAASGAACGDPAASDCDAPDSCDGSGGCDTNHAPAGAACYDCTAGLGLCDGCTATATCPSSTCVTTATPAQLLAPPTGGNEQSGTMFDITTTDAITITSFDQNFQTAGADNFAIYYKAGTFVGFEAMPAAWTLLGSAALTASAAGTLTPIPIAVNLTIPGSSRYAFYLTTEGIQPAVSYHNGSGSAAGAFAESDANVTIDQGDGVAYGSAGFSNTFTPRVWEGQLHYTHVPTTELALATGGSVSSDGVMFDVTATTAIRATRLSAELAAGAPDMQIYFRRGTHVGFESAATGWKLVASGAVTSAGPGALTQLAFAPAQLEAGSTAAFYVTGGAGSKAVLSTTGTMVGATAGADASLAILQGVTIAGAFGGAGTGAVKSDVAVVYRACD